MSSAVPAALKRFAVIALLSAGIAIAQDAAPNSETDLAAAAKLAREQRDRQNANRSERSETVNQMARELSESDEEPISGAPTGYRYYYFKPGDYAILVPADAKPEARDNYGLHLYSEEAFTSRIEVILGNPIPAQGKTPEEIIRNANAAYFPGCSSNLSGLGPPVNGHPAHSGGFSGCGFQREVLGYSEFVIGDDSVMPVICGYPMTAQDWDPSPHQPIQRIVNKYNRERRGFEVCELILPSLKFHPFAGRWKPKAAPSLGQPNKAIALQNPAHTPGIGEVPLGTLARTQKKVPSGNVLTDLKHVSQGYSPFTFRYFCTPDHVTCYSISLDMPVQAKRNEQYVEMYTGLFQYTLPVNSKLPAILQANTGVSTEPGIVSREEFIRTKVDWWIGYFPARFYSSVGQAQVLHEELTEIGGVPARLATFRNPTGSGVVVTYLAAYMVPGKMIHLRCSVAEDSSGDAQGICEHILQSLEIPHPDTQGPAADDPPADNVRGADDSD